MKSNARLLKWFCEYNRKFWSGRLREPLVRWESLRSYRGPSPLGQYRKPRGMVYSVVGQKWTLIEGHAVIALNRDLRRRECQARMTLLHEMAHAALPCKINHGPRFEKEMLRIAKLGAFKGLW